MNKKLKIKNEDVKQQVNDTRRNLTKASATLPFLMSFSRPLWAKDCQPSDLQSGNLSVQPGETGCFGLGMPLSFFQGSNEYWINATTSTSFNGIFSGLPIKVTTGAVDPLNPTFREVIDANIANIEAITDPASYPDIGNQAQLSIRNYLNFGVSPFFAKQTPTDTSLSISDVLTAFNNQTADTAFADFY